jgi:phosphogluconate 2-dehydrogenase
LLRTSDAVSLHLRLSDRTQGVIGRRELALLKDGAIFVNTARGKLVDETALIDELCSGRIFGALDVFADEPIHSDHPLLARENVILTPHAGWATDEVRDSRAQVPVDNVVAALRGHPQNVLNLAALDHPTWQPVAASM